jgi:UDP-glucuronate 4-epimerase
MRKILVTGAAGFIGFHLCKRLLEGRDEVVGLDNLNDYYDVKLKRDRLRLIEGRRNFEFVKIDLTVKRHGRLFPRRFEWW